VHVARFLFFPEISAEAAGVALTEDRDAFAGNLPVGTKIAFEATVVEADENDEDEDFEGDFFD
jgi:hypothetical protein